MTDEQTTEREGPTEEQIMQLVQGMFGLDPEIIKRQKAGQSHVEIAAALTYQHAPNQKCKEFFSHFGTHVLECAKLRGIDLYQNGPTMPASEAANNRESVDGVLDPRNQPPGFDSKRLHTATYKQIAEDLADYVDAAIKRQAQGSEEVNRCAVWDVSEGLTILLRGLCNLTNEPEYVDLQDAESAPDPAV